MIREYREEDINKIFWDICLDFREQTNMKKEYLEYVSALLVIAYAEDFGSKALSYLYEKRKNYYIAEEIDYMLKEAISKVGKKYLFENIKFRDVRVYREIGEENILGVSIQKIYELLKDLERQYINSKEYVAKAYKHLLIQTISREGFDTRNGEIYTPTGIAKTMIGMIVKEKNAHICDPSCGCGNILVNLPNDVDIKIFAKEEDVSAYNLCITNLLLHNKDYQYVELEDFSKSNERPIAKRRYDYIISNPAFVERNLRPRLIHHQKLLNGEEDKILAPGDYAYVMKMLEELDEHGKMAVILPHGALFRTTERGIRTKLVKENYIEAIIGLPENIFLGTRISVVIMILSKDKVNNDVLFIDASNEYKYLAQRRMNVLDKENQKKIIETYQERREQKEFSHIATADEIIGHDCSLTIKMYVKKEIKRQKVKKDEIVEKIDTLEREKDILEENIKDVLEKLDGRDLIKPYKEIRSGEELDYEKIGMKLRIARKEANITLPELATKLEISEAYISRIERGATGITLARLLQICNVLHVSVANILNDLN